MIRKMLNRKYAYPLVVLLVVCAPLLWGLTTITSTLIKNSQMITSTIDSTPIGNTTPSTGHFSSVFANSYENVNLNGAYINWNRIGAGEMDFLNRGNNPTSAFNWYSTTTGSFGNPLMTLSPSGALSATGGFIGNLSGNASTASNATTANFATSAGNASTANQFASAPFTCSNGATSSGIQQNGNANCNSWTQIATVPVPNGLPQGAYTGWNALASGDTDFVNQPGAGSGKFVWLFARNGAVNTNPAMALDSAGDLTVYGASSVQGNLNVGGTLGVTSNFQVLGNLQAGNIQSLSGAGCNPSPGIGNTCMTSVPNVIMPDTTYQATCTINNPGGVPYIVGVQKFTDHMNVIVGNGGNGGTIVNGVDCILWRVP